eukprot:5794314-Lingulodinium_polyedra.AAC.1
MRDAISQSARQRRWRGEKTLNTEQRRHSNGEAVAQRRRGDGEAAARRRARQTRGNNKAGARQQRGHGEG